MLNLSAVNKSQDQGEVSTEDIDTDLLFDIGTDPKVVDIELTQAGSLVSIEEIEESNIPIDDISTESLAAPVFKAAVPAPTVAVKERKLAATLFLKSETNVTAYLYSECEESVDTLIHILLQATVDVRVSISVCAPHVSVHTIIELVSALEATKAKVIMNLVDIQSVIGLLLLLPKYEELTISTGLVIAPIRDFFYSSSTNVKHELLAIDSYNELVFEALADNDILTKEEVTRVYNKSEIIFLDGSELLARIK